MTQIILSDEQQAVVDYIRDHRDDEGLKSVAVMARAGTGKTTLILEIIRRLRGIKGAYLAFNRDIANEVGPEIDAASNGQVWSQTFHSMAFYHLKQHMQRNHRKRKGDAEVDVTKYKSIIADLIDKSPGLQIQFNDAATAWDDVDPDAIAASWLNAMHLLIHFTRVKLVDWNDTDSLDWLIRDYALYEPEFTQALMNSMVNNVERVMREGERQLMEDYLLDFDDMIYWPVRWDVFFYQKEWIFLDEAQDLNPLQRKLVHKAVRWKANRRGDATFMTIVGDPHQCVIEGTMIGDKRAETIREGHMVPAGMGKGKIVKQRVNRVHKKYVENHPVVTITTQTGKQLTTTLDHMHFAEFMHEDDREDIFFTYLMYKEGYGFRIGVTRSYRSSGSSHTLGYKTRCSQEVADAMWLLRVCDTEAESRYYEALYSARYGIPTITFKYVAPSTTSSGMALNQGMIDRLFRGLDTVSRARKLLEDLKMSPAYPHHVPKCMTDSRRRNFNITLCRDARGSRTLHHCAISGSDWDDAVALEAQGFSVTANSRDTGWRTRKMTRHLGKIYHLLESARKAVDVNIIEKAHLSKGRSLLFTPASNVHPGMSIFVEKDGIIVKDMITSVDRSTYTGYVYDFDIAHVHNFVANGIATHNSIYRFTGADGDSFDRTCKWFSGSDKTFATTLPLTVTRRCDKIITHHAAQMVPDFQGLPDKNRGKVIWWPESRFVRAIEAGDMVISRVKAPLIGKALACIREEIPAVILGSNIGKALANLLEKISEREGFTWETAVEHIVDYRDARVAYWMNRDDEARADAIADDCDALRVLMETSEATSIEAFENYVDRLFSDEESEEVVTFCTAHKAKGLQNERVFLLKPDKMPLSYAGMHPEDVQQEKNLHYVAATRAKHVLVYLTNNDFLENRVKPTYVQEDFDDHEWTSDGLVLLSDAPDDYEPVTADEAVADEDVADTEPGLLAPLPDYDRQHEFICPQCDTGYERTAAEMLEFACADCDTGLEPIRQAEHDTNEPDKEIPMTDTPNDDIRKTDEIAVAAESADTAVHLVSDDETTSLAADGGANDEPTSAEPETDVPVTEETTGKIANTGASPDGRRYEVIRDDTVIQECPTTESTTDFLRELDFLNDVQVVQWQDDTSQSEDAIAWLIAMAHGDKRQNNSGDVLKPGMRVRTFLDRVATITHFKGFMAYLVDDDGETWGSNLRSLTPLPDADESDDDTADVSPAGESDTEPAEAMTAPMTRQQQLFAPIITADDDTDDTTATDDDDKTVSPTGGSPDSQTRIKLLRPVKVGRSGRKPDSPVTDDDDSGDDVSPVAEADDVSPTGDSTSSSTTQQIQLTPPQSEFLDWALDPMTERIDELAAHGEACEYTADELPRKVPGQQGLYDIPLSQTVLAELKYHAQRYEEIAREQVGNHPNDPSPQEAAGAERSARNAIGKIEALFETTDDAPVSPTGDSTPETPPAKLPAIPRQPTRWAQHMLDHADRVVIVDFETTDKFDRNDPGRRVEPIQMGIIALDGTVLFNERFMPDGDIAPGAAEIHGVTKASLKAAGASHWRDHIDTINAILRGKYIIAYNKKFDMRVYRDTARHYDTPVLDDNWHCAMLAYVAHNPTYDNGKGYGFGSWWKLTTALEKEGLTPDANAHDALADVQMTRQLIEAMAANDPQKWSRITYDGQVVTYKSHTKKAVYARTDTGESVKIPNNDVQWVQPGIDSIPDSNDTPSEAADVPIADSTPEHTDSDPKPQKSPQSATNDALPTDETPFERMERVVGRFASRDEALEWLELVQDVIDNVHPPAQHETETERESEALPV